MQRKKLIGDIWYRNKSSQWLRACRDKSLPLKTKYGAVTDYYLWPLLFAITSHTAAKVYCWSARSGCTDVSASESSQKTLHSYFLYSQTSIKRKVLTSTEESILLTCPHCSFPSRSSWHTGENGLALLTQALKISVKTAAAPIDNT